MLYRTATRTALLALSFTLLGSPVVQGATWDAFSGGGNWSDGGHWSPGVPQSSATTEIVFGNSVLVPEPITNQDIANPFLLNKLSFSGAAFTIGGSPLQFSSYTHLVIGPPPVQETVLPAIIQSSPNRQVINAGLILDANTSIGGGGGSGGITLNGAISGNGSSSLLDNIPTTLGGGSVTLGGSQTYAAPVTLSGSITLSSTGAGAGVSFSSTVDGVVAPAANVTVNTAGTTTFGGAVGATTPLTSLTTDAGGSTVINGGGVTTGGAQTYGDAVVLGANTTLAALGTKIPGPISLANVDGGYALTVNTPAATTFGGNMGGTTRLAGLTTNAAGTVTFGGAGVATTGTQAYNETTATFTGSSVVLDSSGGNITFAGTLDGAPAAVQVNALAGTVSFGGALGGTAPPASLATVSTNLTAGAITVAGNVDIQASNNLSTGPVVSTTGSVFVAGTTINVPSITAANGVGVYVHGTGTVGVISGPGGFTKDGLGSVTLTAINTYTGATYVQGGILHVSGSIEASSGVSVNTFQQFFADTPQSVRSLLLSPASYAAVGGSALKVGDGTSASPLVINSVILPPPFQSFPAALQLQGHGLIVDYAPGNESSALSQIRSYIFQGYQTGSAGILNNTGKPIGYAQASEALGAGGGSFLGLTADGTSVLVRPTLAGDANLDGAVNFNDLVQLAQHYNTTVSATTESWWFSGDFTNDGAVGFADLVLLAQNYNTALPGEPVSGAPAGFEGDLAAAFASVPEPSACAPLAVGALCLVRLPRTCAGHRRARA